MAFTCADGWVPPCVAPPAAGPPDPAIWWWLGAIVVWVFIAAWARTSRPLRPGVFIGLVALIAFLATILPPDSVWARLGAVVAGFSFLIGEVSVIYRDGARRDAEARAMFHSIARLNQTLDDAEKAREALGRRVDYIVDVGRESLWRRTWEKVRSLSDLVRDNFFARNEAAFRAERDVLQFPLPKETAQQTVAVRREHAQQQVDFRTLWAFSAHTDDVKSLIKEYALIGLDDPELTDVGNRGILQKVEEIQAIQKGLIGLANRLDKESEHGTQGKP